MPEQKEQLARVFACIAEDVVQFCRAVRRQSTTPTFYADELHQYVAREHSVAPASADRVLRKLRAQGVVDYACINRAASLYKVYDVRPVA